MTIHPREHQKQLSLYHRRVCLSGKVAKVVLYGTFMRYGYGYGEVKHKYPSFSLSNCLNPEVFKKINITTHQKAGISCQLGVLVHKMFNVIKLNSFSPFIRRQT